MDRRTSHLTVSSSTHSLCPIAPRRRIAGHGRYVDHGLGTLFSYDFDGVWWDEFPLPLGVMWEGSKAFDGPDRVVLLGQRGDERVFAVVGLGGEDVETLVVPEYRPGLALWTVGDEMRWIGQEKTRQDWTVVVTEVGVSR